MTKTLTELIEGSGKLPEPTPPDGQMRKAVETAVQQTHVVYGWGQPGCLYDGDGPHFADTREEAINIILDTFADSLTSAEGWKLKADLTANGYADLPSHAGAAYAELEVRDGPTPTED